MDNDFMSWLVDHHHGDDKPTVSAANDPCGWVESKLEENSDFAFMEKGDGVWEARTLKQSRVVTITVKQAEGFVSWSAHTNLIANEQTLVPLKVFMMGENGTFKQRGLMEPTPGEPVMFGARHVIEDLLDINEFIERAANSMAILVEPIERIINGADVSEVYLELKTDRVKRAARMRRAGM